MRKENEGYLATETLCVCVDDDELDGMKKAHDTQNLAMTHALSPLLHSHTNTHAATGSCVVYGRLVLCAML